MLRKGFKQWVDEGFPRDPQTGAVDPDKYLRRGRDAWVAVTWDEVFDYSARAMTNIAETYTGPEGQQRLLAQGYDPLMVQKTEGAGTQVLKFRGGMQVLGATRIMAQYRLANSMALLDNKIRGVGPDKAIGARGWDNYTWHTDLPPGHPQVTGQQTVDFDLCNVEHSNLILVWGMNWICTKMPDSHCLTEARMKGSKVVVIAVEYSATMIKADEAFIVRPGTTPALALGLAQVIISEGLMDQKFVMGHTDLPLLVRMDNGKMLQAKDVFPNYTAAKLKNGVVVLQEGERSPPPHLQPTAILTEKRRQEWGDYVCWDQKSGGPAAVNRDQVGKFFFDSGVAPSLTGEVKVKLAGGQTVACRTVFDVTREMLDNSYTSELVEKLTWAPAEAIRGLARQIAANPEKTSFVLGMGPNQFFNNDLKDRAVFLVGALTRNVGYIGGNVGSFAGNYRVAFFSGAVQYNTEDPFEIQLDPSKPAKPKRYFRPESVHYFYHGDSILRYGDAVLTGKTHIPTPTKSIHVSNSNSLIGNAKGHYETVVNTLRRVEFVAVNEWWWTARGLRFRTGFSTPRSINAFYDKLHNMSPINEPSKASTTPCVAEELNPNSNHGYWRGLEQLVGSEMSEQELSAEFPKLAEAIASYDRRSFLRLLSASMALAGITATGCRRWPVEELRPHTSSPVGSTPGVAEYYATLFELVPQLSIDSAPERDFVMDI